LLTPGNEHQRISFTRAMALLEHGRAMGLLDNYGCIEYLNPAAAALFGVDLGQVQGAGLVEILPHAVRSTVEQRIHQARESGEPVRIAWESASPGQNFAMEINALPDGYAIYPEALKPSTQNKQEIEQAQSILQKLSLVNPAFIYLFNLADQSAISFTSDIPSFLGYSEQQIQALGGAFLSGLMHPEDYQRFERHIQNLQELPDGTPADFEYRMRAGDGTWRWFISRDIAYQREIDGRVTRVLGAALDITAQKQSFEELLTANARLLESEERYRLAARASSNVIWDWDIYNDSVLWNEAVEDVLGYPSAVEGTNSDWWITRIHPEDRERVWQSLRQVVEIGEAQWFDEYRFEHANGSYIEVIDRGWLVRDSDNRPTRMIGAMEDVTRRKEAEQIQRQVNLAYAQANTALAGANSALENANAALRESEERFRGTFDNAAVGIAHLGLNGEWLRVNDRFCEFTGYSRDEMLRMTFRDITHPDDLPAQLVQYEAMMRGEIRGYQMEKRYINKSGRVCWGLLTSTLERDSEGSPRYSINIVQDITHRKRLEEHDHFLVDFSNALARARTTDEMAEVTARQIAVYLGLDRCEILESGPALTHISCKAAYFRTKNLAVIEDFALKILPESLHQKLRDGQPVSISDTRTDQSSIISYETYFLPRKIIAFSLIPAMKDGQLAGYYTPAAKNPVPGARKTWTCCIMLPICFG
jgi:PAS domain S-box-containing protein